MIPRWSRGKVAAWIAAGSVAGLALSAALARLAPGDLKIVAAEFLMVAVGSFAGAMLAGFILLRRPAAKGDQKTTLSARAPSLGELHDLAGIASFEWDNVTGEAWWSPGMYVIHGRDPATFTVTRERFLSLVVPQDIQNVLNAWGKEGDAVVPGIMECHITRPNGEVRHVRYAWTPPPPGSDRAFGIAQDITALRATDVSNMRDMVECSADYIWHFHDDGRGDVLTSIKMRALTLLGESNAVGPVIDAGRGHDTRALERAIGARVKFRDLLVPVTNAIGEQRWLSLSGHPQFDHAGIYFGYRGIGTDVTERLRERDAEEVRRQAGAVGRLASGLAHEINNLLQPILIYASFGADEAKNAEKLRLYFNRIASAAERATLVVKNVLAFARHNPPNQECLNVFSIVRETVDFMSGALGARATIEVISNDNAITARVERTGLAQIVTNLISNAVDATDESGHIVVSIDMIFLAGDAAKAAHVAPGRYCCICVEDNGPGMPPEVTQKVFEPFFTTKPQGKGTGLGLSVVLGLARSWNGGIAVDSAVGRGSKFIVYLPTEDQALQAAQ